MAVTAYDGFTTCPHDQTVNTIMHAETDLSAPLTYSVLDGPDHGTFDFETDGSFDYIPDAGFAGVDSFVFEATDGTFTDSATFTLEFTNTPPTAFDASHSVLHDHVLSEVVAGTNADADTLTFAKASDPAHGTVTVGSNGDFEYTPAFNYVGSDSFTFSASDGVATATATVTIDVHNQAPVANDDGTTVAVNTTIEAAVSVSNGDGDTLSLSITSPPPVGTFSFDSSTGEFEYDPPTDFEGSVSFQFEADDGPADDCGEYIMNFQDDELPTVAVSLKSYVQGRQNPNADNPTIDRPGSLEGKDVEFYVVLTLPQGMQSLPADVTIHYETQKGAAFPVTDYTTTSGTLIFASGAQGASLTKVVTVKTVGDSAVEPNEDFELLLTASTKATISTGSATGFVRNNDVTVRIYDTDVTESAALTYAEVALFADGLTTARENGLTIKIKGNTADDSAVGGTGDTPPDNPEYIPLLNDVTNLLDENGAQKASIRIRNDNHNDNNSKFKYSIQVDSGTSADAQVTIGSGVSWITIHDND